MYYLSLTTFICLSKSTFFNREFLKICQSPHFLIRNFSKFVRVQNFQQKIFQNLSESTIFVKKFLKICQSPQFSIGNFSKFVRVHNFQQGISQNLSESTIFNREFIKYFQSRIWSETKRVQGLFYEKTKTIKKVSFSSKIGGPKIIHLQKKKLAGLVDKK